jgi:rubrerythrin
MTTKPNKPDKEKVLAEFDAMKCFEQSAAEMYTEIAFDRRVTEQKIKNVFTRLAEDERRHAGLVQEIIDLVDRAM